MDTLALVLDGILVLIFAFTVLEGRRKGLAVTLFSIAVSVVSFVAAKEYAQPLAQWLNENFVHDGLVRELTGVITDNLDGGVQAVVEALPSFIVNAAEEAGVSVASLISGNVTAEYASTAAENIVSFADGSVIIPLLSVISFLVIFALGKAILGIGAKIAGLAAKLPIIRGIDKTLGALAGAVKGIIVVSLVSLVLAAVAGFAPDNELSEAVTNTVVLNNTAQFLQDIIFN